MSALAVSVLASLALLPGAEDRQTLFASGEGGYHTYRIPALLALPSGAVLALCEGRRHGRGDSGDIDIVLRRSLDGGATWSEPTTIADRGDNTIGNPCPVYDRETGRIVLLLTGNLGREAEAAIIAGASEGTREVWEMHSDDEGASWSPLRRITAETKRPEWTWYATGPGAGIQLRDGRLVVPCDHAVRGSRAFGSHVIVSDDHGATWSIGGALGPEVNECEAVERADGTLLLNMRSYRGVHRRAVASSSDGGETWSPLRDEEALIEPVCQASIRGIGPPDLRTLAFSNPASTERERLTLRLSEDDGASWPFALLLHEGPAAYSCLADLGEGRVGCLYEAGEAHPYERIVLARVPLNTVRTGTP